MYNNLPALINKLYKGISNMHLTTMGLPDISTVYHKKVLNNMNK